MTKPDFIIMGAMKGATSTLHSQLALQTGIFMSTPKEPNFFSDDDQYARGIEWYNRLFESADSHTLCGESSTHYTKLPDYPLTIERMANHLNQPKLIYVMRHPIDRLLSHYVHQWSQNVFKCDINQAIDQYNELIHYSCYTQQLEPYIKQFGHQHILLIFTEAIKQDPQKQLQKIADFIGYQGQMQWQEITQQNVSSERIRPFIGYDGLINSPVMAFLRRTLIPQSVRDKVKRRLTLQERPVINQTQQDKLTRVFDQDLECLSHWLDIPTLNCVNYLENVQQLDAQWATDNLLELSTR